MKLGCDKKHEKGVHLVVDGRPDGPKAPSKRTKQEGDRLRHSSFMFRLSLRCFLEALCQNSRLVLTAANWSVAGSEFASMLMSRRRKNRLFIDDGNRTSGIEWQGFDA